MLSLATQEKIKPFHAIYHDDLNPVLLNRGHNTAYRVETQPP